MDIIVIPAREAVRYRPFGYKRAIMIRITSYQFDELEDRSLFQDVLELKFLDVEDHHVQEIDKNKWGDLTAIGKDQAEQIIKFVDKNSDADALIVHCDAGKSRSPAVALAISNYLHLEQQKAEIQEKASTGEFAPNRTVYDRISEVSGQRELLQQQYEEIFK